MTPKPVAKLKVRSVKPVKAWACLNEDGTIAEVGEYSTALGIYRTRGGGVLLRPRERDWVRVLITPLPQRKRK